MAKKDDPKAELFASSFPHIADWVLGGGYVEIGQTESYTGAFVRALDEGGTVYEGRSRYANLDEALADLDAGIAAWSAENG